MQACVHDLRSGRKRVVAIGGEVHGVIEGDCLRVGCIWDESVGTCGKYGKVVGFVSRKDRLCCFCISIKRLLTYWRIHNGECYNIWYI